MQTYKNVTDHNYSPQTPLDVQASSGSPLALCSSSVSFQCSRLLSFCPSSNSTGRTSLPLTTSIPSFNKPQPSFQSVNGAKAHGLTLLRDKRIIFRVRKTAGAGKPRGQLTRVPLPERSDHEIFLAELPVFAQHSAEL